MDSSIKTLKKRIYICSPAPFEVEHILERECLDITWALGQSAISDEMIKEQYERVTLERYKKMVELNIHLAQELCRQAIEEGHAPFAPQLFYIRLVNDDEDYDISYGMAFLEFCDEVWASEEHGVTSNMIQELAYAKQANKQIRYLTGKVTWFQKKSPSPNRRFTLIK